MITFLNQIKPAKMKTKLFFFIVTFGVLSETMHIVPGFPQPARQDFHLGRIVFENSESHAGLPLSRNEAR